MSAKIHILVLNFNGKDLLEKFLPSLVEAGRRSKNICRLSVIDNASSDGSMEYLKNKFPQVGIFAQKENRILCSYNDVIKNLDDDIVILLNNDIKVEPDFVDPLAGVILKDKDVFLAAPKVCGIQGQAEGANTKAAIKWGVFWASAKYSGFEQNIDKELPTFSTGIGAFERRKFLELGGYDDLYLPGTLEDSDICFRAWKKGWRCLYQPKSVIYHMGQVSFHRRFGKRKTQIINFRNVFLFMWKNITDKRIMAAHIMLLPARLIFALLTGRWSFVQGFYLALGKMGQALKKRKDLPVAQKRRDKDVFAIFR